MLPVALKWLTSDGPLKVQNIPELVILSDARRRKLVRGGMVRVSPGPQNNALARGCMTSFDVEARNSKAQMPLVCELTNVLFLR